MRIQSTGAATNKRTLINRFNKLKKRLEKNISNGRVFSYSRYKREQIINRYQRYARQLKLAGLSAGVVAFLMCANPNAANAQTYEACTPNPFAGISAGDYIDLAFEDIDGDGDLDLLVGDFYGTIKYYQNNGDGTSTEQTGADNPFEGITSGGAYDGYYATPTFADLDGDGDNDLIFGSYYGAIRYYENNAGVYTQLTTTSPLNGVATTEKYSTPVFVDFDGDGDLDLLSGNDIGDIEYFENNAGTFTAIIGAANPFGTIDLDRHSVPAIGDVDGDGDLDLVVGANESLFIQYFENNAGVFTQQTGADNPFDGFQVVEQGGFPWPSPALADLDGDGNLELYVGDGDGAIISICPIITCEANKGTWN